MFEHVHLTVSLLLVNIGRGAGNLSVALPKSNCLPIHQKSGCTAKYGLIFILCGRRSADGKYARRAEHPGDVVIGGQVGLIA